jgi:hypothetical protein
MSKQEKKQAPDSGDASGQGRERRDDGGVYPAQRNAGEFGTHGGPKKTQKGQGADDGTNVEGDE